VILALGALGLLLLMMPALVVRWSRRLRPADWTRVAVIALGAGVATVLGTLSLAATPAVAWLADAPTVADQCRGVLAPLATDPTMLSWAAAGLVVVMLVRLGSGVRRALMRARRARVEPWLGEHHDEGDYELVMLPTPEVVAFGVPGRPPQVVVSTGLVDSLGSEQTAAVIAHEVAHHRLRHARIVAMLAGIERAFAWFAPARRSIEEARTAIEASADCAAGGDTTSRRSLHAALSCIARSTWHADQRLTRLRTRMPPGAPFARFAFYAPVGLLVITVLMLMAGWVSDAHHAVALGASCEH